MLLIVAYTAKTDPSYFEFGYFHCSKSAINNRMADSVDPDETARYEPSHLDVHYLHM